MHLCSTILFYKKGANTSPHPHQCSRRAKQHSPQELKGDTEVVSEVEVLLHVDDVVAVVPVLPPDGVEDFQLHEGLVVEPAHTHV